jgi:putative ABC transport system ATP-binding protein
MSYRSQDTVETHLREVLALTGVPSPDKTLSTFRRALDEIGLSKLEEKQRTMQEVSGGEAQVISLVRTALIAPEGIFLDEPTSAMDAALRVRAEKWILDNFSGAFLWVSHDQDQVLRLKAAGAKLLAV